MIRDLKLNKFFGLLLHDDRPAGDLGAMSDVARLQFYEVTHSELGIDGKIEQGEVSRLLASWSRTRMAQMSQSLSGAFWPVSFPLFQSSLLHLVTTVFMGFSRS
ncbi:MAG: hypothetical protein ABIO61_11135 [Thermomonas sp.]